MSDRPEMDHPRDVLLAAWIDGALEAPEAAAVRSHLDQCERCLEIVAETAGMLEEEEAPASDSDVPPPAPLAFPSRRWPILATAAAIVLTLVGVAIFFVLNNDASPMERVAAVAPAERLAEGRLSGLEHAPLAAITRGDEPQVAWRLMAEIGRLEELVVTSASPEDLHALGVARLLAGSEEGAVDALRQARTLSTTPETINDLVVALISLARESDDPALLSEAIDEIEAVPEGERTAAILFNRALALEELGLDRQAIAAWTTFIETESDSPWTVEARQHIDRLERELERDASSPSATIEAAVIETHLANWASAILADDEEDAGKALSLAGDAAAEHSRQFNDPFLVSLVEATATTPDRLQHARSILSYTGARAAYLSGDYGRCAEGTASAADGLLLPLILLTRSSCAYMRNELGAAARELGRAQALGVSSPIVRGQLAWMNGLVAAGHHDLFSALDHYDEALGEFQSAGDHARMSDVHHLMAEMYTRTGSTTRAMRHAREAVRLHASSPQRLYMKLVEISAISMLRDQPRSARRFLDEADLALGPDDHAFRSDLLVRRAKVAERSGRVSEAIELLDRAYTLSDRVSSESARTRARARAGADLALLTAEREPAQAMIFSREAGEFGERTGHAALVMRAGLATAIALHATGRFEEASTALERVTDSLFESTAETPLPLRDDYLDTHRAILERYVRLQIETDAPAAALSALDRFRRGGDPRVLAVVPPGALTIAHLVLPEELLVWKIEGDHVSLSRYAMDRYALGDLIRRSIDEIRRNGDGPATRRLGEILIPERVPAAARTYLYTDPVISGVPFAVLSDGRPGRPGDLVMIGTVTDPRVYEPVSPGLEPCLLIVRGASTGGRSMPELRRLQTLDSEIRNVTNYYQCIARADTVRHLEDRLRRGSPRIIHIAGHAIAGTGESALLFQHESEVVPFGTRQIEALEINGAIVIITTCSSSDGAISESRGRDGIAQAFLAAGATAVVANLWEVEDSASARFAELLHERLSRGLELESSVVDSRKELHENFPTASVWAGWTIYKG